MFVNEPPVGALAALLFFLPSFRTYPTVANINERYATCRAPSGCSGNLTFDGTGNKLPPISLVCRASGNYDLWSDAVQRQRLSLSGLSKNIEQEKVP
jgi:hypothetical protein